MNKFIIEEDLLRHVIELIGTIPSKNSAPIFMKLHSLEVYKDVNKEKENIVQ